MGRGGTKGAGSKSPWGRIMPRHGSVFTHGWCRHLFAQHPLVSPASQCHPAKSQKRPCHIIKHHWAQTFSLGQQKTTCYNYLMPFKTHVFFLNLPQSWTVYLACSCQFEPSGLGKVTRRRELVEGCKSENNTAAFCYLKVTPVFAQNC